MKKKTIIFLVIIIIFMFFIPNYSHGIEDVQQIQSVAATGDAKINLRDLNKYNSKGSWSGKLVEKVDVIFSAIRIVGIILSIIILMAIGLKFMLASVEEKAEYKKSLIPYLIGTLILFTGSLFANLIYHYITIIVKMVSG